MLKYVVLNKAVPIEKGQTILRHSILNKIPHLHECGGHGMCTTCRIRIVDGVDNVSKPSKAEKKMAAERQWDSSIRLGCQVNLQGGPVSIERLIWTNAETANLQLETIKLGTGEEKEMAFLFCDMRNYTQIAEAQSNFDLAFILNRFFTALGDPVYMNNGIIYQYAGDEIIALFGVGGGTPEKICMDAVRAGMGMLTTLEMLNKWEFRDFITPLKIGVGIHFGKSYIGNIGHERYKQFAVVGDPMNVTSRIQTKNKDLGTQVLISKEVKDRIPEGRIALGLESTVYLKGKKGKFQIYEVVGFTKNETNFLIQSSIKQILSNEVEFAARFYQKLFARAPEVRNLFTTDMLVQGYMLTHMLRGVVYALSRPDYLKSGLRQLGIQHKEYGVLPEHYPIVKEVLLETISETLGDSSSDAVRDAWNATLDIILDLMRMN